MAANCLFHHNLTLSSQAAFRTSNKMVMEGGGVLANEMPSHIPRLNFDHLEHPYTSRFFSSPEQWINQLISLMDNFQAWRDENEFQWFSEGEFKTVLWLGAGDENHQKRMIDPKQLFKDFSQIGYQDSIFTRNKKNTNSRIFQLATGNFHFCSL